MERKAAYAAFLFLETHFFPVFTNTIRETGGYYGEIFAGA